MKFILFRVIKGSFDKKPYFSQRIIVNKERSLSTLLFIKNDDFNYSKLSLKNLSIDP